jgi:hypothetical protein
VKNQTYPKDNPKAFVLLLQCISNAVVVRFFLAHDTKTGKNVPNEHAVCQLPQNIPNGHKMYQHFSI